MVAAHSDLGKPRVGSQLTKIALRIRQHRRTLLLRSNPRQHAEMAKRFLDCPTLFGRTRLAPLAATVRRLPQWQTVYLFHMGDPAGLRHESVALAYPLLDLAIASHLNSVECRIIGLTLRL